MCKKIDPEKAQKLSEGRECGGPVELTRIAVHVRDHCKTPFFIYGIALHCI